MALRWGYSLNCWTHCTNSVRKDNNERNIKVCAAGGFEGIEMQIGFGRWKPLGRPDIIKQIYGEPEIFKKYLENLGIKDIVAWDYDAAMFDFMSPGTRGYEPSCASDTDEIVSILKEFAEFMKVCSCKYLVVRPVGSFWRIAPLDEKKLQIAANCWNAVGEMTARYGVK
ncbi:MAG: hypothetical protein Q4D29_13595, partial [Lachnospiraceae bacterium]|nr:hypothetical protein [Lachnospiraceae bacterium]